MRGRIELICAVPRGAREPGGYTTLDGIDASVHGDPAHVDPGLNRDEARTISTDDRYLAKKGQRHIAPDAMRIQIDSRLDRLELPRRTHAHATSCRALFERVPLQLCAQAFQAPVETDECTPAVSGISTQKSPCHVAAACGISSDQHAGDTSDRPSERPPKGWVRKVEQWRRMKGC